MVTKVAFEDKLLFFEAKIWKSDKVYPCDKPRSFYKFGAKK
jgi:hypothetical protein